VRVGLMLYTLRAECERDLRGTLRSVARLGYEGVEFWQLHGHKPASVRGWLDEAGLVAVGSHATLGALEGELPLLAEELRTLGTDRVALSFIEPEPAAVTRVAKVAEDAAAVGLRFGFHNHAAELQPIVGAASFLDLLRELPPELLWLELDLGWIWHAGGDPVAELAKSSGRCPLVHLKDFRSRHSRDDVPIGDGAVGYERVLPAALKAGVQWLLVEEDDVEGEPLDAVARSLDAVGRLLVGSQQ
jgi:sugar phosphate isomerase/epimerase